MTRGSGEQADGRTLFSHGTFANEIRFVAHENDRHVPFDERLVVNEFGFAHALHQLNGRLKRLTIGDGVDHHVRIAGDIRAVLERPDIEARR